MYRTQGVIDSLWGNYQESLLPSFVEKMAEELKKFKPRIVRIHTAGDFYNVEYTRKWIELCQRFHTIRFFAYTRSWRQKRFYKDLRKFAGLQNVSLWWSVDADTHAAGQRPPRLKGTRVAYLLTKPEEKAGSSVPSYADLVFRHRPYGTIKYYHGRLVCPAEQDRGGKAHVGCSECKLCFTDREIPKRARAKKDTTRDTQSVRQLVVLD
jgi:hypothetical protein